MDVVFAIILLIAFFVLISYLLGSFVQLLSNLTGRRINIRSGAGWTSFRPKKKGVEVNSDLELFNRQMEAIRLQSLAIDQLLSGSKRREEISHEYEMLPQQLRSKIWLAVFIHPKFSENELVFPFDNASFWQVNHRLLYSIVSKIDYEDFKSLSTDDKQNIKDFISEYRLESEKIKQLMQDRLMLEIEVKKTNNEFSVLLLPINAKASLVDIAFKDICLFLKSYPEKNNLQNINKDGYFKISIYSKYNDDRKLDALYLDEPANYVVVAGNGISYDEMKRMIKFGYKLMPSNFKSTFVYDIDFDRLTF